MPRHGALTIGAMNVSLPFPGFSSPAAGPEAPLQMLAACHTRVDKQCHTLVRLQAHLPLHGSDTAAQEAAAAVLRYFDTAARHHHEDEEQDLFPALHEAASGSDALGVHALTAALVADHRTLETHWAGLRPLLQAVAEGDAAELSAPVVGAFVGAYRAHTAREDRELLPLAERLLGETALAQIGQAMRARRGF